jgi:hypothetical protein
MPKRGTDKIQVIHTRNPKFRALVSMGLELRTANKMMCNKPLECTRRSRCEYLPIPPQDELKEAMVAIAAEEKLAPLGKVELRVSAQSPSTPEQEPCMPNKQSLL